MKKSKTSVKIPKMDMCQTPGYAVEPLIDGVGSLRGLSVWECACGEGYLAHELGKFVDEVYYSDKNAHPSVTIDQTDFLLELPNESMASFDAIITNPPFSIKREFTEKALEYRYLFGYKIALLMQTEVVSTKWFGELVKQNGQPGIIWFNPRINFKMPNKGWDGSGSHFSTAWFTWGWFEGNKFVRMNHWTKEYRKKFET